MARMATTQDWAHLSTPGIIRARSRALANDQRQMLARLVAARKKRDMRQADVAAVLGVSPQAISKLEHYDADPKLSTLQRYANAVGVVIDTEVRLDDGESLSQRQSSGEWAAQTLRMSVHTGDADRRLPRVWSTSEVVETESVRQHFALVC